MTRIKLFRSQNRDVTVYFIEQHGLKSYEINYRNSNGNSRTIELNYLDVRKLESALQAVKLYHDHEIVSGDLSTFASPIPNRNVEDLGTDLV